MTFAFPLRLIKLQVTDTFKDLIRIRSMFELGFFVTRRTDLHVNSSFSMKMKCNLIFRIFATKTASWAALVSAWSVV